MLEADTVLSILCRNWISFVEIHMMTPLLISNETHMPIVLSFAEEFTAAYLVEADSTSQFLVYVVSPKMPIYRSVTAELLIAVRARDSCCGCCRG